MAPTRTNRRRPAVRLPHPGAAPCRRFGGHPASRSRPSRFPRWSSIQCPGDLPPCRGALALKQDTAFPDEILDGHDTFSIARQTRALHLLQSLPGIGEVRARRHLIDLGISDSRRVQRRGERQRERLVELFPPQD
ncbi:hypothetical protein AB4039_04510 [Streptomyces sp. M-16]|uniref:hypothetical protein n=1 Tax=Streptomyces sp. M-16 TaxID=3233040 RepID=UPI0022598315